MQPLSSDTDFKTSFPFCVLCMAVLSLFVVSAMNYSDQTPADVHPESTAPAHPSGSSKTPVDESVPKEASLTPGSQAAPEADLVSNQHDWDRGSAEDKYWEDGADV